MKKDKLHLVAVVGAPLQGKTTLSRKLAETTGYFWKDIDDIRLAVFGFRNKPVATPDMVDLSHLTDADKAERNATSRMLLAMTEGLLEEGESIIVTARSAGRPENVVRLQTLAQKTGAELKVIRCLAVGASREEIERRMASTATSGAGRNVRPFVTYEQYLWILKQRWEEEQGEQSYPHVLINTMEHPDKNVSDALAYIRS